MLDKLLGGYGTLISYGLAAAFVAFGLWYVYDLGGDNRQLVWETKIATLSATTLLPHLPKARGKPMPTRTPRRARLWLLPRSMRSPPNLQNFKGNFQMKPRTHPA